jgi:predicted  nucleic acid-binding Zn-ribbon protein
METGRKHIPVSLFKAAERLDKEADRVIAAINDIGAVGNAKKRAAAVGMLRAWLPQAQNLSAKVHSVDEYVKRLEAENRYQKDRNDDIQEVLVRERSGAEDKEWEHYRQIRALRERLHKREALMKQIPPEVLEQITFKKERGKTR